MYNAVIFDLDGTLLDTLCDIQEVLNKALLSEGLQTHDLLSVRRMVGHGLAELVQKASPDATSELKAKLVDNIKSQYLKQPFNKALPYEGIIGCLLKLKERGIVVGVLTNKHHPIAQAICNHFFADLISGVQGEEPGLARKPDPSGFERLVDKLGIRGLDIAFVGDSETDIATAKNAKVPAIGVSWGFRDKKDLEIAGADMIVGSVDQLNYLLGLDS